MFDSFIEPTTRTRGAAVWKRERRAILTTLSAAMFAVAPKCPICFLAYFGIFGVATTSASAYHTWLPAVTGFWLALTIAMVAFQSRGRWRYEPALLGLIAALLLVIGKFIVDSQAMIFAGMAILFGAAAWRARIQQSIFNEACAQCEQPPIQEQQHN